MKRLATALLVGTILAFTLSACGQSGANDEANDGSVQTVKVALDWVPNTFHYWFFAALERGYYSDAGLKVEFQVPDSTTTSLKLTSLNQSQIGISIGSDTVTAYDNGLPVQVINTIAPAYPLGMLAPANKVSEFADAEGKTVGVINTDVDHLCFNRMLNNSGLSESDVEIVDPGFNLVPPLLSGKLTMVSGSANFEKVIAERESGEKINFFHYSDVCPQPAIELVANKIWAEDNPQTVKSFNAATLKGLVWAMENPEQARDMFVKLYPDYDPDLELAMWNASLPVFCAPHTSEKGLGYSDPGQWQAWIDLMAEQELVSKSFDSSNLLTNDYLPDKPVTTSACE